MPSNELQHEHAPLIKSEHDWITERLEAQSKYRWRNVESYANYCLISGAVLFCLATAVSVTTIIHRTSDTFCTSQLSTYSPLVDSVEYEDLNFDNGFLHQSVYRGPPTNKLEREWERLWNHDLIGIPRDDFHYLHKPTDGLYKMVPGGGFAANIEVFHQLHCLNLIRQYTWRDYYDLHPEKVQKPTDFSRDTAAGLRTHVDHCIETLRLNLMCHGDVTPYLIVKEKVEDLGVADFNAHHKCRRFDKIVSAFKDQAVVTRWENISTVQYKFLPD